MEYGGYFSRASKPLLLKGALVVSEKIRGLAVIWKKEYVSHIILSLSYYLIKVKNWSLNFFKWIWLSFSLKRQQFQRFKKIEFKSWEQDRRDQLLVCCPFVLLYVFVSLVYQRLQPTASAHKNATGNNAAALNFFDVEVPTLNRPPVSHTLRLWILMSQVCFTERTPWR